MPDQQSDDRLTFLVEHTTDFVIVRCRGRLVSGEHDRLHVQMRPLISERKRIVLDLTDVTIVDSTGLGTLVRLYVSAKSAGCDLELINLGKRVRELLGVTNLTSVFTIIGEKDIRIL